MNFWGVRLAGESLFGVGGGRQSEGRAKRDVLCNIVAEGRTRRVEASSVPQHKAGAMDGVANFDNGQFAQLSLLQILVPWCCVTSG